MQAGAEDKRPKWLLAGGRTRLGRALAELLAPDHDLVLTSSRDWEGEGWVRGLNTGVTTLVWDAAAPDLEAHMVDDLAGLSLDGAVMLAGSFPEQPFGTWTRENLEATWRINQAFPVLAAQAAAPRMRDGACLQFIVDAAIYHPFLKRLPYTAAKAGLAALVPGLARALAPRLRVVGHALGTALPGDHDDVDALKAATLLGRIGTPEDLARALCYAAGSPYLTGQILTLDGGWSIK
ncbi:MAG TPA: SDR family oxidoreductase [Holophagaceae bacterium]|jgi:NAD(P)-dependent dehydrogenase (short-subunit alcohol dehydrogenase family)|nr:SDR family oxidoreductase [Holophagaceae bacterium]